MSGRLQTWESVMTRATWRSLVVMVIPPCIMLFYSVTTYGRNLGGQLVATVRTSISRP